jgi:hypothetical protein
MNGTADLIGQNGMILLYTSLPTPDHQQNEMNTARKKIVFPNEINIPKRRTLFHRLSFSLQLEYLAIQEALCSG